MHAYDVKIVRNRDVQYASTESLNLEHGDLKMN